MLERTLEFIYRPQCPACDASMAPNRGLCATCAVSLYPIDAACPGCAEPIEGPVSVRCARCRARPLPLERVDCGFRFGGQLAVALRRLKFANRPDVARVLAPLYRPALTRAAQGCDLVIPVPLHWRRSCVRGFNQAQLLLRHGATGCDARLAPALLRRARSTRPQPGLTRRARASNLAGAFVVPGRLHDAVRGRSVLVFDDVITTGATVAACARALLEAGATSVRGFAVARAESP